MIRRAVSGLVAQNKMMGNVALDWYQTYGAPCPFVFEKSHIEFFKEFDDWDDSVVKFKGRVHAIHTKDYRRGEWCKYGFIAEVEKEDATDHWFWWTVDRMTRGFEEVCKRNSAYTFKPAPPRLSSGWRFNA